MCVYIYVYVYAYAYAYAYLYMDRYIDKALRNLDAVAQLLGQDPTRLRA